MKLGFNVRWNGGKMKQADRELKLVRQVWQEIPANTYPSPGQSKEARLKRMCELNPGMRMTEASDIYERNRRYI